MENLKVKVYVDRSEAIKIAYKYLKKKKKDFDIESVDEIYFPYYIFNNVINIKRGFKLKPRVIRHLYWVNAFNGNMIRTKDVPDYEKLNNTKSIKPILDKEQCIEISKKSAFQHAGRFYKSFWAPEIKIEEKGYVYLADWKITVKKPNDGDKMKLLVNSFSGQVVFLKDNEDRGFEIESTMESD